MLDRHDCYELCVQSPRHVVAFLRAAHAGCPRLLREDFSGTACVAREWCDDPAARAIAVDLDPDAIARAARDAVAAGLELRCADVLAPGTGDAEPADVVFVGNFSIGYIHRRHDLLRYFRACHQRLSHPGPGILAFDLYGGPTAFALGGLTRTYAGPDRQIVRYHWLHEAADASTGMVRNSISFQVRVGDEVVQELPRAFVYEWRLWSPAELRDALSEAGFVSFDMFTDIAAGPGAAPTPATADDLRGDFVAMIVARSR